ncbi:hypothetical protein BCR39DRAFT_535334 [Naematelia encephala]|uniref:Nucleolar protein 12-domain-containing protein n=1 Tax=Naematelia encephala TaxID=71784 RepID=A0A1Y2B0F6_9TREE|nr:hypothetical protein BCR39DRAFT_535334 [Naematelia encephala]
MSSRPIKRSNVSLLTEGQAYINRAKKVRREQIEEIKFDDEARREWLSGFSKRKKAKLEERRARAKKRDHEAHLEERREARKELRERAAENVKTVRKALGLADEDQESSEAGPSSPLPKEDEEEVYSDDDQQATITITEDFDPILSTLPPPPLARRIPLGDSELEMPASSRRAQKKAAASVAEKTKSKDASGKERVKSMETKSERRMGRAKESQRRKEKATLAMDRDGGKRKRGSDAKRGRGGGRGRGRGNGKRGGSSKR